MEMEGTWTLEKAMHAQGEFVHWFSGIADSLDGLSNTNTLFLAVPRSLLCYVYLIVQHVNGH